MENIYTAFAYDQLYSKLYSEAQSGSYTSYIRGERCKTEDDFFREISASFQFPKYFGENWPALDECLCDLEWLKFKKVFVVVDDFSKMFNNNSVLQDLVAEYLICAANYWKDTGVPFEVLLNN